MGLIDQIISERTEIIKKVEAEWEEAQNRKYAALIKHRKRHRFTENYPNWQGIVDDAFAHCGDGMSCTEVDPCPMCQGTKKMPQYSKDITEGFRSVTQCPTCKGSGVAWYKYGTFEIREESR